MGGGYLDLSGSTTNKRKLYVSSLRTRGMGIQNLLVEPVMENVCVIQRYKLKKVFWNLRDLLWNAKIKLQIN